VHDPRNVLLDEPTNGLDVMTTRALRRFLVQLKARDAACCLEPHHAGGGRTLRPHRGDRARPGGGGRAPRPASRADGRDNLEDAFVQVIGSDEGLFA